VSSSTAGRRKENSSLQRLVYKLNLQTIAISIDKVINAVCLKKNLAKFHTTTTPKNNFKKIHSKGTFQGFFLGETQSGEIRHILKERKS